ncbi:MAG: glycosyltransferase family 39 protein [bacterium]|nr:glycosyltransferase family 39 protein [bacterium]
MDIRILNRRHPRSNTLNGRMTRWFIAARGRLGVVTAAAALACFCISAYEFRADNPAIPPYTTPVLWMIAGAFALGAALFISGKREPVTMPQTIPLSPNRFHYGWTLCGILLLGFVAEVSAGGLAIKALERVSTHVQFALWAAGIAALWYGMAGAPPPRIPRYNPLHGAALGAILILALALRGIGMGDTIWQSIDEVHWADGVRMIWHEEDMFDLLQQPSGFQAVTAVYTYWNAGTVALFGRSWMGLRFVNAIIGTFAVLAMYGLGRALFDRRMALIAALVLATFPPHLQFSRISLAHITDSFIGIALIMFVVRGMRWGHRTDWAAAGVMLGLSQYFFESGRLFFPVMTILWCVGMLLFTPNARKHLRGMGIVLVIGVIMAVPVYYNLMAYNQLAAARLDHSTSLRTEWLPLLSDGLQPGDIEQMLTWALTPFAFFVSAREYSDFWGGPYALLHPLMVPLFLMGVFYCLWRLRSPLNVFPLYVVLTGLGSALMLNKWGAPRYVIVLPVLAFLIAIGIRYGLALLIPEKATFAPKQSPFRLRPGHALIGLAAAVVIFHPLYYFTHHLAVFNHRLQTSRAYPDMFDAVERAAFRYDTRSTQLIMVSYEPADVNVSLGIFDFFVADADRPNAPMILSSRVIDQPFFDALPRDRNYLFMVEPGLNDVTALIVRNFARTFPPEPSHRVLLPAKQFWAYYVPIIDPPLMDFAEAQSGAG